MLMLIKGGVRNQIPVSQDSQTRACAPSVLPHHRVCVLPGASALSLMEMVGGSDHCPSPWRGAASRLSCQGLISYNGGAPLFTKYRLSFLDTSLRATLERHLPALSTLRSWSFSQTEMGICSVYLRNAKECGCSMGGLVGEREKTQGFTGKGWILRGPGKDFGWIFRAMGVIA